MGGFRASDYFAQGQFVPPSVLAQGSLVFWRVGPLRVGPSLGGQLGFDSVGAQFALQPGVALYRRLSGRFALTGRIDANVLFTRGVCDPQAPLRLPNNSPWRGEGSPANQNIVPAPNSGYCPTVAMGFETAVGAALFIRSGLALAGELTFNLYGGDGGLIYPVVGVGLGVLFDHEVLP